MKNGSPPRAGITAARWFAHAGKVPSERSSKNDQASPSTAKRRLCEEQLTALPGTDAAGVGSDNPYDIGTEATLAALRRSGILTRSGKLGKTFR